MNERMNEGVVALILIPCLKCRCPVILYPLHKTIREMNKSIPLDGINCIEYPLKTKIRHTVTHKMLMPNIILQSQCIVSGRFCGPSPYIFDIYLLFPRTTV